MNSDGRWILKPMWRVSYAPMYDFLWETYGPGLYDGKQSWKHREADDQSLQSDQLEREKLICSGEERVCRRESGTQGITIITLFLLQQ